MLGVPSLPSRPFPFLLACQAARSARRRGLIRSDSGDRCDRGVSRDCTGTADEAAELMEESILVVSGTGAASEEPSV